MLSNRAKMLSMCAVLMLPLLTGCIAELSVVTFGTVLLLDFVLIPVRSALGAFALDFVNNN